MTIERQEPIRIADLDAQGRAIFDAAKDQIAVLLIAQLGGQVRIPVEVLDEYPVGRGVNLRVEGRTLVLELIEGPNVKIPGPNLPLSRKG